MNLTDIKTRLLEKGQGYHEAGAEMSKKCGVLFEFAEILAGNEAIERIVLMDKRVVVKLRAFPVSFYLTTEKEYGILTLALGTGQYESEYAMKMISMMRGKKTIVDVGANLGFYSVIAGKLYPSSRIYSFEPIPQTFAMLEDNIRLNGIANAVIENIAFADKNRTNILGG